MSPLVAKVTGTLQETLEVGTIRGYVAIEPDGQVFAGTSEHGILVLRDPDYLKRIVSVDAKVIPVTLTIHPTRELT